VWCCAIKRNNTCSLSFCASCRHVAGVRKIEPASQRRPSSDVVVDFAKTSSCASEWHTSRAVPFECSSPKLSCSSSITFQNMKQAFADGSSLLESCQERLTRILTWGPKNGQHVRSYRCGDLDENFDKSFDKPKFTQRRQVSKLAVSAKRTRTSGSFRR